MHEGVHRVAHAAHACVALGEEAVVVVVALMIFSQWVSLCPPRQRWLRAVHLCMALTLLRFSCAHAISNAPRKGLKLIECYIQALMLKLIQEYLQIIAAFRSN